MKLIIDISGDVEIRKMIDDLGGKLSRWGFNRAFKPAAQTFVRPYGNYAWSPTPGSNHFEHRTYRLGKTGPNSPVRVRAIKRTRKMSGVMMISQFGTTNSKDDPYYGAFVNWGHEIVVHGIHTGKRTKPKLQADRAFDQSKGYASSVAVENLKQVVLDIWYKQATA